MTTDELMAGYLYHASVMLEALAQRVAAGEDHYRRVHARLAEALRDGSSEELHELLCEASIQTAERGDLLLIRGPRPAPRVLDAE